jgi:hypothetical protein
LVKINLVVHLPAQGKSLFSQVKYVIWGFLSIKTKIATICNLEHWGRFFKNVILPASANKTSTVLRSAFAGSQMLSILASQWFSAIRDRTFDYAPAECGLVFVVVLGILAGKVDQPTTSSR